MAFDKKQTLPSIKRELGLNLLETFNWAYTKSQLFFARYGLTSQQYNVLKILAENDKALSTSDILAQMVEKNAGVSRLVDRLVLKKLVVKETVASDKRLIAIIITNEGETLLNKVNEDLHVLDEEVYGALSDQEADQLNYLLKKIKNIGI